MSRLAPIPAWQRSVGILGIFGLVAGLSLIQFLNFTGFCYRDLRYYSDQEFKDAAVRSILSDQAKRASSQQYFPSIREFYNDNPDCCRIYRWRDDPLVSLWARVFGWYVVLIDVIYRLPWYAENRYFNANAYADACTAVFKVYTI